MEIKKGKFVIKSEWTREEISDFEITMGLDAEKIMVKNLIIVSLSAGNRVRCTASLVERVEGEDESLVNDLDLIGMI